MPSPFESGERKVIPAVLIYARRSSGEVLMIHRGGKPGDYHEAKWNGLGGKLELDESPGEAARREFHEEAGILLPEVRFRTLGWLQFPHFKAHKHEDWHVVVLTAQIETQEEAGLLSRSDEGSLHWVPSSELLQLNLWAGDREFLPWVLAGRPFSGTFWYDGQILRRHQISPLG